MRRCPPPLTTQQARGFFNYYHRPLLQPTCIFSEEFWGCGAHLSSSQAHYHPKPPMNTFSRGDPMMLKPQIVKQYKQVSENSFFPLFTATNTRVQTSQDLYCSPPSSTYHYPRREPYHFPRREPRMPQSLLEQMLSGEIFRGNPNQNQTVTQYNRLYTEMSRTIPQTNLYTALPTNVVQSPFRQDHHRGEMLYEVYIKEELSLCINLSHKDFGNISVVDFEKTYAEKNVQIKPYGSNQKPQNVVILNRDKEREIFQKAEKSFRITEVMFV